MVTEICEDLWQFIAQLHRSDKNKFVQHCWSFLFLLQAVNYPQRDLHVSKMCQGGVDPSAHPQQSRETSHETELIFHLNATTYF